MMVDRGKGWIAAVMAGILGPTLFVSTPPAWAGDAEDAAPVPVPLRVPQGEPWPGFRPDPDGRGDDDTFPLSRVADPVRWEWWDAGIGGAILVDPGKSFGTPSPAPSAPRFSREGDAFREVFDQALDAARENRSRECLGLLGAATPTTLEGTTALRELAFAAHVAEGDRSVADSLFYRLSWNDQGRTASRLAAWRALEKGEPVAARRALQAISVRTPGEEMTLALTSWEDEGGEGGDIDRLAALTSTEAAAMALLKSRRALLGGRPGQVGAILDEVSEAEWPPAWRGTRDGLRVAAGGGEEGRAAGPDAREYDEAAGLFLRGEDAAARTQLDAWLTRWLDSPYRSRAALIRADLELAARSLEAAEADLRVAETRGDIEVRERARLTRVFLEAARGRSAEARAMLDEILSSPLGARQEPELLFNRARLERQAGDDAALAATLRLLEEGYGDTGWHGRAVGDVTPADWRIPYRRLPAPPAPSSRVPAPTEGPWQDLLWGENVLARAAAGLEAPATVDGTPSATRPADVPPVETVATLAVSPSPWQGVLAFGGGSRLTGFVEGGASGRWRGMGLRLRADGLRTNEPSDLPVARVGGLEFGASGAAGVWRWSGVGEARGRRLGEVEKAEGPLPRGSGPVEADWWGTRLDVRREDAGARITRVQGATLGGEITAEGRGRWVSRQQWVRIEANPAVASGDWRADFDLARFDLLEPEHSRRRFLFPDLRLVRRFPGGFHLGGRGAYYRNQGILLPVAGVEHRLADGLEVWAATEPGLDLTSFRETFLETGDWNLPDFTLPAQRRSVDLRAGMRYRTERALQTALRWQYFIADAYRTWREDEGFWIETARENVEATRLHGQATLHPTSTFSITAAVDRWWTRSGGEDVAYVPTERAELEFSYEEGALTLGTRFLGVRGRRDGEGRDYGSFLRWDVEAGYRVRGSLEYSLRIENLTGAEDRRWPGLPAYGRGVFAGMRARFGS